MDLTHLKKIGPRVVHDFPILLTLVFLIVGILGISVHELWRDETQAWLFARDSSTIFELIKNLRYEGHPPVWHLLLFVLTRFVSNPFFMQLLHLMIASSIVYLFAKYAPFKRLHKILFSFSYLILYEYGILARNYSLGILLGVIFCILYTGKNRSYIWCGLVLLLMTQTNAMGALLATILSIFVCIDFLFMKKRATVDWKNTVVLLVLAGTGLIMFYIQTRVPADGAYTAFRVEDLRNTLSAVWQSFVPIPAKVSSFWNTNYVPLLDQTAALSILLILASSLFFVKQPKVFALYLSGLVIFLSFFYFITLGGLRHQGYVFIFFLLCVWLQRSTVQGRKKFVISGYQNAFLTTVLIAQLAGGFIALYKDIRVPFTHAERTASYINEQNFQDLPIVGQVDYQTSALLGFLATEAYYAQSNTWGSFVVWNEARLRAVPDQEVVEKSLEISKKKGVPVLLVTNHKLEDSRVKFRQSFTGPVVVVDETYFLYLAVGNE